MALRGTMIVLGVLFVLGTSGIAASAPDSGPDPGNFVSRVDNPWFPLVPGTTFVYRGVKDGKSARDVFTVTRTTRTIQGVRCTAVADRLYLGGRLEERTTDWYAQDKAGNVWYFGEATAELDAHGKVTSREGSWLSGVNGAQPGVFMPAHPRVGQSFRQEYYKGHAEDHFRVAGLFGITTPKGALLTEEWTPLEPGVLDHKLYARGVGQLLEQSVKGPTERLALISMRSNG